MSDQSATPSGTPPANPVPTTPAPTSPLPNDAAARSPTGELKDATLTAGEIEAKDKAEAEAKAKTEADKGKKPDEKPARAPEKYEDFKVPDGFQLAPEVATKAQELFKTANLPQDVAQSFMDFHVAELARLQKTSQDTYDNMRKEWQNEVLKDNTLAINGEFRPEVKATMSKVIDSLGPDLAGKFRESLNLTGEGDNPAFVRGFYELSKRLSEGTSVTGAGPSPKGQVRAGGSAQPSAAQALFPELPSSRS